MVIGVRSVCGFALQNSLLSKGANCLQKIKQDLAILLKVDESHIGLDAIDTGLTHQSYRCRVSGKQLYVKIYNDINNISNVISYINQLTEYMRERGIPASRLYAWSPAIPNIVVHEYVEGEMYSGDFSQLASVAKLFSNIVLIGADHSQTLPRSKYLADLQNVFERLKTAESRGEKVAVHIHSGMLDVAETVLNTLADDMPEEDLFHIHVHDDFTEKNILMQGDQVKLLCDWDSCRLKLFNEYLACTVTRFSTDRPLAGVVQEDKLTYFLCSLDPELHRYFSSPEQLAALFPYWATLKHLRTYMFRNSRVNRDRPDLYRPLLEWPLEHCQWLLDNRQQLGDWVYKALTLKQSS